MKLIPLTQSQFAQVDDEDFEWLNQWKWYAVKKKNTFYAMRAKYISKGKIISYSMHREILGLKKGNRLLGDHIDLNGLNNKRNNLRIANESQNSSNRRSYGSSVFLGVRKRIRNKKGKPSWFASIIKDKIQFHLGVYKTEIEAANAYNSAAKYLHGVFANLNKIPDQTI